MVKGPIEWLTRHAPLDARWQLVHATHVKPAEIMARDPTLAGRRNQELRQRFRALYPERTNEDVPAHVHTLRPAEPAKNAAAKN